MKKLLLGLLATSGLCLAAPAMAADYVPPEPAPLVYGWTGAYVGGQVGYAFGDYDVDVNVLSLNDNFDGITGGLHAGYLHQFDSFVIGIEGDVELSGQDGKVTAAGDTAKVDMDLAASVRARLGFAIDNILIYATGGLAIGDVDFTASNGAASDGEGHTFLGYTVGGGLEFKVTDNLRTRIEYRYTDLGSHDFKSSVFPADTFDTDLTYHAVRVGVSWQF